jgi:uncharacterized protein
MKTETKGPNATPAVTEKALGPVEASRRIDVMDILRGFALIGIIFMNVEWFNRSASLVGFFDTTLTGLDHVTGWLVRCFVEGKFYKIFTLLFGMGFTVMLLRAQQADRPFGAWFSRRMLVLLLFGLFHAIFIWSGDILHDYAIGGLVFLLWIYAFRTRRLQRFNNPVTFLKIGIVWLVLPLLVAGVVGMIYSLKTDNAGLGEAWARDVEIAEIVAERLAEAPEVEVTAEEVATGDDVVADEEAMAGAETVAESDSETRDDEGVEAEAPVAEETEEETEEDRELTDEERKEQRIEELLTSKQERKEKAAEEDAVMSEGSYLEGVRLRLSEIPVKLAQAIAFSLFIMMPLCLVGYWFIASDVLRNHRDHRALFRNMALIGTSSGFLLSVGGLMVLQHPAAEISRGLAPVGGMMFHLSQYLMSAGYIGMVILFSESRFGRSALALLAPFGRMALTNYIMQSVILSFVFYSYGAGLYGTVPRASQMLLVIGILAIQIAYSKWWMAHFRFGPLEWVWRSATYKSLQPMRI